MTEQGKFGEPWELSVECGAYIIRDVNRTTICREVNISPGVAYRIVACVNACEGVEDPAAEIAELKRQAADAKVVIDRLTDEIKRLRAEGITFCNDAKSQHLIRKIREAQVRGDGSFEAFRGALLEWAQAQKEGA